ncbi:Iron-sulfur cluster carrier protein [Halomicronema hongdechloris C2206]|uniref:Iron-sulfur cluster carrier protein n=1 Tax=Halomicronema hongdechloris C2206 TaxID=1641165 RepID=A0A1Z3HKF7_9CYAN|nr:Mrp/NBP35 family ATP-binding protein [Halomicronema hongdechloris]ASC70775.1 Iron-sulfur cluster carrier protein [Halomicronema hongdechloris C2206]
MPSHSSPFHRAAADPQADTRKAEVIARLQDIQAPTLPNNLVNLGMVRNLQIVDDYVYLRLYVGTHQRHLQQQVQQTLTALPWCKKAYAQLCTIPGVRTTLAVSSGKGGVGKSTTAVNLAAALTRSGAKVGLLDADIYGPNVPHMLGLGQSSVQVVETDSGQRFLPLDAHGIKLMSVGLLAEQDHPLAWRGPVMHKILTQFLQEVEWGDLDYLLIDLPPGTGDAQITIMQESPICGVIMVTTPQQVAVADVRRSVAMFRQVGVPVLGLVENMSYLLCGHCGNPTPIFGSGGGAQIARDLQVPLWGQVPLDPRICALADAGVPLPLQLPDASVSQVFAQIAAGLNGTFGQAAMPEPTLAAPKSAPPGTH